MNRDHSVIFEIASKYCILDSFVDRDGHSISSKGFLQWLRWKSICLQCGRPEFNPWVGKISWRREWQPMPVFLPPLPPKRGQRNNKPRQHIKKQSHYFANKGPFSQSYGFSSSHICMWVLTIKKAEHWRTDTFELWRWRRLLRVFWTARRWNQSILKEINPEYSLEALMLKLKHQYFGHLMRRANSLEKTLMLGKIEGKRRRRWQKKRWLDSITDSVHMNLSKLWEMVEHVVWFSFLFRTFWNVHYNAYYNIHVILIMHIMIFSFTHNYVSTHHIWFSVKLNESQIFSV